MDLHKEQELRSLVKFINCKVTQVSTEHFFLKVNTVLKVLNEKSKKGKRKRTMISDNQSQGLPVSKSRYFHKQ